MSVIPPSHPRNSDALMALTPDPADLTALGGLVLGQRERESERERERELPDAFNPTSED